MLRRTFFVFVSLAKLVEAEVLDTFRYLHFDTSTSSLRQAQCAAVSEAQCAEILLFYNIPIYYKIVCANPYSVGTAWQTAEVQDGLVAVLRSRNLLV